MPGQPIPPMPPLPGPDAQKGSSPRSAQGVGDDDHPIRLKPEAEKLPVSSQKKHPLRPQVSTPSTAVRWETTPTDTPYETPKKPSRFLVPSVACLALCLIGALFWSLSSEKKDTSPAKLTASPDLSSRPKERAWKAEAQLVLHNYLEATAKGDLKRRMLYVTPSLETQTVLPRYQAAPDTSDVVDASSFVAKTLPESFLKHGIYLMYYQRPNTLSNDAVFRPIVPMRVNLKLDSPSFLDIAARSGRLRDQNQQNICAFFKRNDDGQLTLDWPIFAQTRHRQLARFVHQPDLKARKIFRLMVLELEPSLKENIYNQKNPGNDWYRIHCPGYGQETHVISVPGQSPAASFLKKTFSSSAKNHRKIHAITAELAWLQKSDNQQPTLEISKIICLEFLGLNAELKTK